MLLDFITFFFPFIKNILEVYSKSLILYYLQKKRNYFFYSKQKVALSKS